MAEWKMIPKHMNASDKIQRASKKYAEERMREANQIIDKLDRMAILFQENKIAAARQMWFRNKFIRGYVPNAAVKILFP